MWTQVFWKQSVERAVKTFAQSVVAMVGASSVQVLNADLKAVVLASLGAAILSVLTSVASSKVNDPESPSAV
jgi:hypothetical protein